MEPTNLKLQIYPVLNVINYHIYDYYNTNNSNGHN